MPFRHFNDIFMGDALKLRIELSKESERTKNVALSSFNLYKVSVVFLGNFEEYLEYLCRVFFCFYTKQIEIYAANEKKNSTNNTLSTSDVTFFHDFYKTFPYYAQFVNVVTMRKKTLILLCCKRTSKKKIIFLTICVQVFFSVDVGSSP